MIFRAPSSGIDARAGSRRVLRTGWACRRTPRVCRCWAATGQTRRMRRPPTRAGRPRRGGEGGGAPSPSAGIHVVHHVDDEADEESLPAGPARPSVAEMRAMTAAAYPSAYAADDDDDDGPAAGPSRPTAGDAVDPYAAYGAVDDRARDEDANDAREDEPIAGPARPSATDLARAVGAEPAGPSTRHLPGTSPPPPRDRASTALPPHSSRTSPCPPPLPASARTSRPAASLCRPRWSSGWSSSAAARRSTRGCAPPRAFAIPTFCGAR